MTDVVINFDSHLGSVQVNGHQYERGDAGLAPNAGASQHDQVNANDVSKTLDGIESGLSVLAAAVGDRNSRLQSMAISCAMEAARVMLNSSQELIEERLGENLSRLLTVESEPNSAKVYVHSSCQAAVERLLAKRPGTAELEVIADQGLVPGDCRVDFGRSGQLAALDNQLDVIKSRFEQFARENSLGGTS